MPRLVSFVIGLVADGPSTDTTHTFITLFMGAKKLNFAPSGTIQTDDLSGLPKRTSREISGYAGAEL